MARAAQLMNEAEAATDAYAKAAGPFRYQHEAMLYWRVFEAYYSADAWICLHRFVHIFLESDLARFGLRKKACFDRVIVT